MRCISMGLVCGEKCDERVRRGEIMREICGVWCEIRVDARCDDDGEACFRFDYHLCVDVS